jgi:hypothetical protein
MIQATLYRCDIIRQRLILKGFDMLSIIKRVVVVIVSLLMAFVVITELYDTPPSVALVTMGLAGALLAVIGILTNVRRSSPVRVGVINRAEFYGVVVVLISCIIYLNTRIDQIMFMLMK